MKQLLTVKEYAKELNISRQAVYKKLDNELKPYLKVVNNQKMISSNALKEMATTKVDKQVDEKDNQITTMLSNTIEILTKQLSIKDNQIEQQSYQINQLNERIKELTERIADLTELQRNNQVLMLHDKKPKLLERIFKKKEI